MLRCLFGKNVHVIPQVYYYIICIEIINHYIESKLPVCALFAHYFVNLSVMYVDLLWLLCAIFL